MEPIYNKSDYVLRTEEFKSKLYETISRNVASIKSNVKDGVIDVTSFENLDFNSPVTKEQFSELKNNLDFYIFKESADEIKCDIKTKENDGIDSLRLKYGKEYNIPDEFRSTDFKRIPDNYEEEVQFKVDTIFWRALSRRVLVEKINHHLYPVIGKYHNMVKSGMGWTERKIYRDDNELMMAQERFEIAAGLREILIIR